MAAEPSKGDGKCLEEQTSSSSSIAAVVESSSKNKLICSKFNNISPVKRFEGFKDFKFEYPTSLALRRTYRIIEICVEKRVTSLQLRRLARQLIKESLRKQGCEFSGLEYVSLSKPSALQACEMCSEIVLTAGACPITDCNLRPEVMRRDHLNMHLDCTDACYFWRLYNVARCGWSLPNKGFKIKRIKDNHPPFQHFGSFSQESLDKQLSVAGAVEEVDGRGLTINPLLSVVRNSDLWRAHGVGLNVVDEASLQEANGLLERNSYQSESLLGCWCEWSERKSTRFPVLLCFDSGCCSAVDSRVFHGQAGSGTYVFDFGFSVRFEEVFRFQEWWTLLAIPSNAFRSEACCSCLVCIHVRSSRSRSIRRRVLSHSLHG